MEEKFETKKITGPKLWVPDIGVLAHPRSRSHLQKQTASFIINLSWPKITLITRTLLLLNNPIGIKTI